MVILCILAVFMGKLQFWIFFLARARDRWPKFKKSQWLLSLSLLLPLYWFRSDLSDWAPDLENFEKFTNWCKKITLMKIILGALCYVLVYVYTMYFGSVHGEITIFHIFLARARDRWPKFQKPHVASEPVSSIFSILI